jgi:hypothetical protein
MDVATQKIQEVFSEDKIPFIEKIRSLWPTRIGDVFKYLSAAEQVADKDFGGINTPLYCLLILQEEMKQHFLAVLLKIQNEDLLYKDFVRDVWLEVHDKKDFHTDEAEAVLLYFEKIDFRKGVEIVGEVIEKYSYRIKSINQNVEKEDLLRRLYLYCQFDDNATIKFKELKNELQKF